MRKSLIFNGLQKSIGRISRSYSKTFLFQLKKIIFPTEKKIFSNWKNFLFQLQEKTPLIM